MSQNNNNIRELVSMLSVFDETEIHNALYGLKQRCPYMKIEWHFIDGNKRVEVTIGDQTYITNVATSNNTQEK